ncbi:DUF397 domain-containing protein [Actinomadura sp. KC06]|uniref:DUF397 domain-containing protein n=1 Tax=Actinomadura sp. KC06 TaxID=2530369 RepID=UPI0010500CB4|nr:DUF397 domain-containing protein [Actinomadura sp. KC06]TDD27364.1 DUF397 domain-containing protein [Actinomadura sp. KC06]
MRTTISWRKSSHSDAHGQCVEVAAGGRTVLVRDSKHPDGDIAFLPPAAFAELLASIKAGHHDLGQGEFR